MSRDGEIYTPGGPLLTGLTWLLVAGIAVHVVGIASTSAEYRLLSRIDAVSRRIAELDAQIPVDEDVQAGAHIAEREELAATIGREAAANDSRQMLLSVTEIGLLVVTAIFFLRALSRANRNARSLGAVGMEYTPGWCIGWFFVPIANLFKPFQATRETWRASSITQGRWQDAPSSPLVGGWWALWIGSRILNQAAIVKSRTALSIPEWQSASVLSIVAEVVGIVLNVVALLMIRRLYLMQEEKYTIVRLAPPAASDWKACWHCGEPVDSLIGNCPMCGEALGPAVADPSRDKNWRW